MANGKRATLYFKNYESLKNIAEEENIELNGATLEQVYLNLHLGEDEKYQFYLKSLYNGDIDLRETLSRMIRLQAYNDNYMRKDNIELVKVIRDATGTSQWYKDGRYAGDYALERREYYIDCMSEIYGAIARMIERNINLSESKGFEEYKDTPWRIPSQDLRYKKTLQDKNNYSRTVIQLFLQREADFKSEVEASTRPGQILDLLLNGWEYFWNFKTTYEAIEFCLALTENISDNALIRKRVREFSRNYSMDKKVHEFIAYHTRNHISTESMAGKNLESFDQ